MPRGTNSAGTAVAVLLTMSLDAVPALSDLVIPPQPRYLDPSGEVERLGFFSGDVLILSLFLAVISALTARLLLIALRRRNRIVEEELKIEQEKFKRSLLSDDK